MGNNSGKSALDSEKIIHPTYTKNPTASTDETKSDPNENNFALKSQSQTTSKQLWLIRHGERMDEVGTSEAKKWRQTCADKRKFDPPLTKKGFKQAKERGNILLKQLSKYKKDDNDNNNNYPKCIYSSPTERTLGTSMSIAMVLKLPIIVIPGLSSCAAAVKTGGLIKKNMNEEAKDNDDGKDGDYELFLKHYGWVGECNFLTKKEIKKKFGKNGVEILFDYKYVDKFKQCVTRLVKEESESNITLCVTHREGIRYLDEKLMYSRIPYCGLAKYEVVEISNDHPFGFAYFERD